MRGLVERQVHMFLNSWHSGRELQLLPTFFGENTPTAPLSLCRATPMSARSCSLRLEEGEKDESRLV